MNEAFTEDGLLQDQRKFQVDEEQLSRHVYSSLKGWLLLGEIGGEYRIRFIGC